MARKKKRSQGLAANIIFSLIALFALTVAIVLLLMNYNMKNELETTVKENETLANYAKDHVYTEEELDSQVEEARNTAFEEGREDVLSAVRDHIKDGNSTFELLRNLYPDQIVVPGNGGYEFFDISDRYKKHDYILDHFREDESSGIVTYTDDAGNVISRKGIDVSRFNGEIDWEKVAADGVEYAFIRCGYRGASEGKLVEDDRFRDNIEGALNAGIRVGVYFFTQAVSGDEGQEEAEFVLDLIEDYDVTFPVVYDVETYEEGRAEEISSSLRTDAALAFLDTVKNAGYTPMLYANLNGYFLMLDLDRIEGYDKWFAYYSGCPVYYPYEFSIWQYSAKGKVDGIEGNCDLNVCMKEY